MDTAQVEQQAGDECMRVADDYTAIGEHDDALTFARQAHRHYERAAAIRARQSEVSQSAASRSGPNASEAGESSTGTTEAA